MLTLKLGQLDGIIASLNNITSKDIPIKISYQLSKLLKKIYEEYKTFSDQRNKIVDKYGEKDDKGKLIINGNSTKIKQEFINQCTKELQELCDIEFQLDFSQISIEALGEINIKPQDLYILDQFFTE